MKDCLFFLINFTNHCNQQTINYDLDIDKDSHLVNYEEHHKHLRHKDSMSTDLELFDKLSNWT